MSDQVYVVKPTFYIERCENCHLHQWCTRHVESKYIAAADSMKSELKALIPEADVYVN